MACFLDGGKILQSNKFDLDAATCIYVHKRYCISKICLYNFAPLNPTFI